MNEELEKNLFQLSSIVWSEPSVVTSLERVEEEGDVVALGPDTVHAAGLEAGNDGNK